MIGHTGQPTSDANSLATSDLSIIIVTWNSSHEIVDCLESVLAQTDGMSKEVYVVDNASQDDTTATVARRFPQVSLLVNDQNLGFAAANNLAIEQSSGRHILLLNPDTIVKNHALSTMVEYMDTHPSVGALGPRLTSADGHVQPSCLRYPSVWNTTVGFLVGGKHLPDDMAGPSQVGPLSGAALMVRREVAQRVGGLDPDYFMYGEDADWCYRIEEDSWEIHYLPEAEIIHLGGQSAGQVPVESYVWRRMARLLFVKKHRHTWEHHVLLGLTRLNLLIRRLRAKGEAQRYYHDILKAFNQQVASQ